MLKPASLPIVALTMGDPAGIGPEVLLKAAAHPRVRQAARCLAVGDAAWLARCSARLGLDLAVRPVGSVGEATFSADGLEVIDLRNLPADGVTPGQVSAAAGKAAVEAVRAAALLATQGLVDAMTTAPLNKAAMHLAGFPYAGHTELLAELAATRDYCMMLISGSLRVFQVTTHVSLRQACDRVTRGRVRSVIGIAHRTLQRLGIAAPRIAVAGLNPHAGEGGIFGDEEQREIEPAIADARAEGINASGPWPGDTVFARAQAAEFDGVLAMYHDQGHIPVKLHGFQHGVNVTAGLSFIRTSPDHGTAFDIAGRGIADPTSMVEAIELAARMVSAVPVS